MTSYACREFHKFHRLAGPYKSQINSEVIKFKTKSLQCSERTNFKTASLDLQQDYREQQTHIFKEEVLKVFRKQPRAKKLKKTLVARAKVFLSRMELLNRNLKLRQSLQLHGMPHIVLTLNNKTLHQQSKHQEWKP